jgi:nucleotidyltransferase/DNA polymerase involved in DNA repair
VFCPRSSTSSSSAFGHLDADCFYVSAERARYPALDGKPVGILGNQGAFVIAKSYELRRAGVKTGEPIWEALKKCPEGVYLKRDFRWYEVLSRRLLEVVRDFSPAVEYFSIDEFFFEAQPRRNQTFQELAEALRGACLERVGVPVTVGIGRSKTLAKLLSDTAKPFGALALVDTDTERALLDRVAVHAICGIGTRRAAALEPFDIRTCLDFAFAERLLIRRLLTWTGEALWWELNGTPVARILTDRPPHKVLSRGGSLGGATTDPDRVYAWLVRNVERLVEELEFHAVTAGTLALRILHVDGTFLGGKERLSPATDRFDLLVEAGRRCLLQAWDRRQAADRMHLDASDLRRPGFRQRGLFEPPEEQARAVARVKREVNAKLGRFKLRSAATVPLADIYRDEAQSFNVCDIRGKMCF